MKKLRSVIDVDSFFHGLCNADQCALLLDYDGTLAPFQVNPEGAIPYPGVREAINRILAQGRTRLVIVTGRTLADLIPLLALDRAVEIWGEHGGERAHPEGNRERATLSEVTLKALERATLDAQELQALGARCERKASGIAIHWRNLPIKTTRIIRTRALALWGKYATINGLKLHDFDGGIELRARGHSKADAVKTILSEMKDDAIVACLGDDQTDEDAFAALQGKGLSVLVRSTLRPTRADLWLTPPEELLQFLQRWEQARDRW